MKRTELKELYQMMFPDYPDIVTTAQLQKMLGISRRLVYQLIGDGSIPGILIGNTYKIPKLSLPRPIRSITMISTLTAKVAVPKLMPVRPEMPSDSVFQALVPALPASTPNRLPKPMAARPATHTSVRRIYPFTEVSFITARFPTAQTGSRPP